MATGSAQMMWTLQFTAIRAFLIGFDFQSIMRPAHSALGRRSFSFRYSHC